VESNAGPAKQEINSRQFVKFVSKSFRVVRVFRGSPHPAFTLFRRDKSAQLN
jgi:hypothetical protein